MSQLSLAGRMSLAVGRAPRVGVFFGRLHGRMYGASGGRLGRRWFGVPVLVLHTVGRRTGDARATTLIYLTRGDEIVVVAGNGGQARTPSWFLNLDAAGGGEVEVGGERFGVRARQAGGDERAELWDALAEVYPTAEEYLTFSDREYQVVVLSRVG